MKKVKIAMITAQMMEKNTPLPIFNCSSRYSFSLNSGSSKGVSCLLSLYFLLLATTATLLITISSFSQFHSIMDNNIFNLLRLFSFDEAESALRAPTLFRRIK